LEELTIIDAVLAVGLGVTLASACGLRVFLPLLVVGIGQRLELPFASYAPEWMSTYPALILFGAAAVAEILAYYVPWLDNALDTVATPLAVSAGALMAAGVTSDLDPAMQWTAGIVGGGGAAVTHLGTSAVRAASTAVTGGLTNFVVSTLEWVASLLYVVAALLFVPAALVLLVVAIVFSVRAVRRLRRRGAALLGRAGDAAGTGNPQLGR
jgi:hypothetical protein